jgi:hypothetical protein
MKRTTLTAGVLVLPLLLAACGGDDNNDNGSPANDAESSSSPSLTADQAAVKDALVASLLDPDCDLLTDDYLIKLSVFGDAATPEEACDQRKQGWIEPQFSEDDIIVSHIEVAGDVATAVVGSDLVNITTTYQLMLVDGSWRVSCDDFTCDDLVPESPEVS